jgi:hypothetical protein
MRRRGFRAACLLGLVPAVLLLTACAGLPVLPTYTEEELAERCARTGGWWHPGSQFAGHCEYRD